MRYIHFIIAFVAFIVSTACTTSTVDDVVVNTPGANRQLQVVGRITQFSDCDVATRSKKDGDEPKVTSMGLALFPIDGNTIGDCVYYDYEQGSNIVFIVERGDEIFNNYTDKQFAMYIFANMQDAEGFPTTDDAGRGKSFAYFNACAVSATTNVTDVPKNGFPMVGSIGNNTNSIDADGIELILKPTASSDNPDGLPERNGIATDNLEISMKALFAKFSFTISVKPDQEIVGNKAPRFDLMSYEVHNIASTVDSDSSTNDDAAVVETSGEVRQNSYAQGATTTTFNFYLPERYLTPADGKVIDDVLPDELKKKTGTYDQVVDANQNGYRDQDERYHQRFKNLLPGADQKATYVTINGKFTDHQGHTYDVAYNIYLGGNNYDNFDIIRNTHYNNSITIRGIATSNDQSTDGNKISIDHRVDIERTSPLVINIRRETLLDAHFEVRPLRLRISGEEVPAGATATVEVLNADGTNTDIPNWIRLERNDGTGANTATHLANGKRLYFTTDLVSNTLAANTLITVNDLGKDNSTIWIYVDENTNTGKKSTRSAMIRITYTDKEGLNNSVKDYIINQYDLHEVTANGYTYYIECHEEYLYNYDSEDSYGQTEENGMKWGLEGTNLSNEHQALYIDPAGISGFTSIVQNIIVPYYSPYYDYYLTNDLDHVDSSVLSAEDKAKVVHNRQGYVFCNEIIETVNANDDNDDNIGILSLGDIPKSAVEYCYNRNKRKADGTVASVDWYLPSIDQMEDIVIGGYGDYVEFQAQDYWSCQPAYYQNAFHYNIGIQRGGSYMTDNTLYARATSVEYLGGGTDDPNNYKPMESQMNNYYQVLKISGFNESGRSLVDIPDDGYQISYLWYSWSYPKYSIDAGYQPRTEKNRIRCVRKM